MLGDTGVVVHPEDPRYRELIGTYALLPFLDRRIPILADEGVDPAFGSGAVKVTPGHDPADYERGARHRLPIVNILEKDGRISAEGGPFAGLSREQARKQIVAELEARGLLEKIEDIEHNLTISDRSKSPIEPLVSEQWFVRMRPLAEPALKALREGCAFVPARALGQDLPRAGSRTCATGASAASSGGDTRFRCGTTRTVCRWPRASISRSARAHPVSGKPIVRRDPDVLDTWASSWLWPIATHGLAGPRGSRSRALLPDQLPRDGAARSCTCGSRAW